MALVATLVFYPGIIMGAAAAGIDSLISGAAVRSFVGSAIGSAVGGEVGAILGNDVRDPRARERGRFVGEIIGGFLGGVLTAGGGSRSGIGNATGQRSASGSLGSGGPPPAPHDLPGPSRARRVLLVGAENDTEFAAAHELRERIDITTVNVEGSEAARAYQARGGRFIESDVRELPPTEQFDLVHENYPQPYGRTMEAATNAQARFQRVAPGGMLTTITEDQELVELYRETARLEGMNFRVVPWEHSFPSTDYLEPGGRRYLIVAQRP